MVALFSGCTQQDIAGGLCTAQGTIVPDGADLSGNTTPRSPSTPDSSVPGAPSTPSQPQTPQPPPIEYDTATSSRPTPSLGDVAHFLTLRPRIRMEPDGWAVAGSPANFVAVSQQHTVAGALLGAAAEVRFTPVSYRWDFGDGSVASASRAGSTWAALGQRQFSDTSTSHRYAKRGGYRVSLTVTFTAEYRFAGGAWSRVPGTLGLESAPLDARVLSATTVLVAGDCLANPVAPGC